MSSNVQRVYLLDVNILLALAIHYHPSHNRVMRWFQGPKRDRFSTCAITQSGLVRLFSNPSIYKVRVSHEDALIALHRLTALPGHIYWPMDVDYVTALSPLRQNISTYKQTTDAYLLGLAIHHQGIFATMDQGIATIAGTQFAGVMELIP